MDATERTPAEGMIMVYLGWLGEGCLLAGRHDDATRLARRALDLARAHKSRGHEAYALRLCGEIAARRDSSEVTEADASYHQSLALATDLGMRPLVAHCHLGLGTLYRHTGQREQAHEHLINATTMYREMDMRVWLEQAEVQAKELA